MENRKALRWVLGICVVATLGITVWDLQSKEEQVQEQLANYQVTQATVVKVYPPNFTKFGRKQQAYDLVIQLTDSTTTTLFKRELDAKLEKGSLVLIQYNPENRYDKIYLK